MSESKKYFWIKLQKTFYSDVCVKKLRSLAGGDTYIIIYQKLLLETIGNDGLLILKNICDEPSEEIALLIDEDEGNIKACLNILHSLKLCEFNNNNELFFHQALENTGKESESTKRVRAYRERQKNIAQNKNIDDSIEATISSETAAAAKINNTIMEEKKFSEEEKRLIREEMTEEKYFDDTIEYDDIEIDDDDDDELDDIDDDYNYDFDDVEDYKNRKSEYELEYEGYGKNGALEHELSYQKQYDEYEKECEQQRDEIFETKCSYDETDNIDYSVEWNKYVMSWDEYVQKRNIELELEKNKNQKGEGDCKIEIDSSDKSRKAGMGSTENINSKNINITTPTIVDKNINVDDNSIALNSEIKSTASMGEIKLMQDKLDNDEKKCFVEKLLEAHKKLTIKTVSEYVTLFEKICLCVKGQEARMTIKTSLENAYTNRRYNWRQCIFEAVRKIKMQNIKPAFRWANFIDELLILLVDGACNSKGIEEKNVERYISRTEKKASKILAYEEARQIRKRQRRKEREEQNSLDNQKKMADEIGISIEELENARMGIVKLAMLGIFEVSKDVVADVKKYLDLSKE